MPARKLSPEQQIFLVTRLACFDAPSDVRHSFAEAYGETLTLQCIQGYDASTVAGARDLSAKLTTLFTETRAQFLTNVSTVPIAQRAYRLRRLDTMARAAEGGGNYSLAAALLEQAARETGDMYTNLRRVGGPDGESLQMAPGVVFVVPSNGRDDALKLLRAEHTQPTQRERFMLRNAKPANE